MMAQRGIRSLAVVGFLTIAVPAVAQEQAPAPSGTVVLRGSTPANATPQLPPPGPSNPLSTGPLPRPVAKPAHGWDASGFDRQFDHSGLTPQ